MDAQPRYSVMFFDGNLSELLGRTDILKDAQQLVQSHPAYKRSWFGKKGNATVNNPNPKQRYRIWDNTECLCYWSIRA